ncbi:MAG: TetR/AcrR family transcriptional regulator, partial [Actinomycetes bacterium]
MSVEGSVRERRRAETVREIKEAALRQIAEVGPGAMSLRGVARAVGMTVQSLYHYFANRDALLTELVVDANAELARAVEVAVVASRGRPHAERLFAATNAYRTWALEHRSPFLLIYGTPVPGFVASGRRVDEASVGLAAPFLEAVFDGWSPEELAAVPLQPGAERIAELRETEIPLPPGALALFYELRFRMHGQVMLEVLGRM